MNLTETFGDMRVGLIRSRTNDVTLFAQDGSILDGDPSDAPNSADDLQDVQGDSILLLAIGSIGTEIDFLEINLDDAISTTGLLTAAALLNIDLWEVTGDLRLSVVVSFQTGNPGTTDVALVAEDGSILDGADVGDPFADVQANRIDLKAGDAIGSLDNDLEIDSSTNGPTAGGRIYAEAINDVAILETRHELTVLGALSRDGNVRLTIPDTNGARGPPPDQPDPEECPPAAGDQTPSDCQPEDLILLPTGTKLVFQNHPQATTATGAVGSQDGIWTTNRSGIWAKLDI